MTGSCPLAIMLRPDDRRKDPHSEHGHPGLLERNTGLFYLLMGTVSHEETFSVGFQDMVAIATWAC